MDSPCLSAAGLRFLDHPVPAGGSAFLAVGSLRRAVEDGARRPRRDFRVPHVRRCDRGGCLLCAGAEVSAAGPMEPRFVRPRRRCRRRVRRPSPPHKPSIAAVLSSRRFASKVQSFTRPIFASPGFPRWLWLSLGFHPGFTPPRYWHGMLDVATELDTAHGPMRSLLSCGLHVAPIV